MDKKEMRERLEKYLPKRVLDAVDEAIAENSMGAIYLERIKPYKTIYMPEIKGDGLLFTAADMLQMFRYGLHHNIAEKADVAPRKPLYKSGDTLKAKDNPKHTLLIKGYSGDRYKVKDQGMKGFEFYSMDYVEDKFEML